MREALSTRRFATDDRESHAGGHIAVGDAKHDGTLLTAVFVEPQNIDRAALHLRPQRVFGPLAPRPRNARIRGATTLPRRADE